MACNYGRLIQTRFRCGSAMGLALLQTITRWLIMQKARGHALKPEGSRSAPTAYRRRVSGSISLPSTGCFSPFPHGTGSLSVSGEYLALDDGPPRFTQGFTCPELLRIPPGFAEAFDYRALTFYGRPFQAVRLARRVPIWRSYNPSRRTDWFGLVPVRSPLLRESRLISFPTGT